MLAHKTVNENEMVNVEWMHSLLKIDLNRFLGYKNRI